MELPLAIGILRRLVLEILKSRAHHGVGAVDGLREQGEEGGGAVQLPVGPKGEKGGFI